MRAHRRWQLCLAVFLLTLAGCAEKTAPPQTAAPETPSPPPPAAAPPVRPAPTPSPPPPSAPPLAAAPAPPPPPPAPAPAPAAPAAPEYVDEPALKDVLFDAGSTDIGRQGTVIMRANAGWLTEHSNRLVLIEGYSDYKGTPEGNMAAGERRATAAKEFLVKAGISEARIKTISYGSDRPVCPQKTDSCAAKNRRVHFQVSKPQ